MVRNQMNDVFPIKDLKRAVKGRKRTTELVAKDTIGINVLRDFQRVAPEFGKGQNPAMVIEDPRGTEVNML